MVGAVHLCLWQLKGIGLLVRVRIVLGGLDKHQKAERLASPSLI